MKIEESKNKENIEPEFGDEDDYLSDYEEQENNNKNNNHRNINYDFNAFKKFNIYFHFAFNKTKKYLIHICNESFRINNSIHIYNLIEYIINKINNSNIIIKYNDIDYSISVKDIEGDDEKEKIDFYINNYDIIPFNFLSEHNSHSYCSTSLLKSIKEENIVLLSKDFLNIMILKKI